MKMGDFDAASRQLLAEVQTSDPLVKLEMLYDMVTGFEKCIISIASFQEFVSNARDIYFTLDTSKRCMLLRAIRYSTSSPSFVKALISEEFHWLVVESLERDSEYSVERIQALKLMDKVRTVDGDNFPVAFGRSIIAVANSKDDAFRKICLESLRELAVVNASLVASLHGFATLIDAVLEPITQDLADNITLTLLYLLNDPVARYHFCVEELCYYSFFCF